MTRAKVGFSMKTSLDHLPESKRNQLQAIVEAVRSKVEVVDMVILFGSYARGDWVEDHATQYYSDYVAPGEAWVRGTPCRHTG